MVVCVEGGEGEGEGRWINSVCVCVLREGEGRWINSVCVCVC